MLRFNREKILPVFLKKEMTIADLSRKAGVAHRSAERAVEGEAVAAPIINKIADALGIDAMEFLDGGKNMTTKKTVTITRDDGTTREVEILADETNKTFSAWGDDKDIRKAFAQYFKQKAEQ